MGLAVLAWAAAVPLDGAYQQGLGLRGVVEADAIDLSLVGDDLVVLGLITVGLVLGLLAPRARDFATLGAALAIAAPSVIGHTRAYEPVPLLVVTDVLHLAAGAAWLGGLVGPRAHAARRSPAAPEMPLRCWRASRESPPGCWDCSSSPARCSAGGSSARGRGCSGRRTAGCC